MAEQPFAMVIEDDKDLAAIFADTLKEAGFQAEVARDGRVAMERLAAVAPDVVVLDMNLPLVSGAEVLKYIRTDKRLANTRVIIATANPQIASMVQDQADLVLIKPVGFSQLFNLAIRLRSVRQS
ncbi:MAG: response regulator [Anaerolineae bacterium]|nr:response regulator [Anaerolineae bacterium]